MALVLSFVKLPAGVSLPVTTHSFDESGGSIGRGDGNELTLPDPDRFLSSKHCHISCEGGQYYVSDTSTNGTFVNGAHEALGRGGKFALHNGNTLELGDYQFTVGIGSVLSPSNAPVEHAGLDDPFATDVFASAGASTPAVPFDDHPFATPFGIDEFESISPSLKPTESLPSFDDDPFSGPALNVNAGGPTDPLTALDGANFGGSPLADQGAPQPKGFGSELDDFLGVTPVESPAPPVSTGKTFGDNADPLAQSMSWPETASSSGKAVSGEIAGPSGATGGSVIPDDWDDLLGNDKPLVGAATGFPSAELGGISNPIPESVAAQPIPDDDDWDWGGAESHSETPQSTALPGNTPIGFGNDLDLDAPDFDTPDFDTPDFDTPDFDTPGLDDLGIVDNVGTTPPLGGAFDGNASDRHHSMPSTEPSVWPSEAPQVPRPVATPKPPTPPRPTADDVKPSVEGTRASKTAGLSDAALMDELLSRMGLSIEQLDDTQKNDVCLAFADLIPVVVSGMMQVLRSRASIKNEFRMNVTTIQPVENNPLKFSATAAEAMEKMFVHTTSAYKRPAEAFQEGFDGISEHQVAIIAGIRAAFKSIMQGFDPGALERQFERQGRGIGLPGMQKARYWSSYVDYYQNFVDDMENSFQHLFGDEFVDAYEEQLRTLAAERKNKRK